MVGSPSAIFGQQREADKVISIRDLEVTKVRRATGRVALAGGSDRGLPVPRPVLDAAALV
jgi:hypothetical protein